MWRCSEYDWSICRCGEGALKMWRFWEDAWPMWQCGLDRCGVEGIGWPYYVVRKRHGQYTVVHVGKGLGHNALLGKVLG